MQLQMAGKPRHFQTRVMSLLPPSYFVHKPTPKEDGAQEPKEVTRNTEVLRSKVDNDGLRWAKVCNAHVRTYVAT